MQKLPGFVLKPGLLIYFLCTDSIFHIVVPLNCYFHAISCHACCFIHIHNQLKNSSFLQQPLWIPVALATRKICGQQMLFLESFSSKLFNFIRFDLPVCIADINIKQSGGDCSSVLHSFFHKRPTLIRRSQLKLCRS